MATHTNPADDEATPASWHCGGCDHSPAASPDLLSLSMETGATRRHFMLVTGAAVAAAAIWRGRGAGAAAIPTTPPLTSTASPADALSHGLWLAGDTHVHSDHSSDGSATRQGSSHVLPGNVSVADQIGQAHRMGLQFLPITDHRTYDQHWDPLWSSDKVLLIPGEEANGSPHATVHGCIDEVIDGAATPGSYGYRHIQQSIWEVQAQGGVWSTAHPDEGEFDNHVPNANAEAVGVNVVEVWNRGSQIDTEIDYAENRWNAGWRFGGVGGCDCHFRELWGIAGPGMPTTYVLARAVSERAVLDAMRAGRTTLSADPTGAFLTLEADLDGDGVFETVGGDEVAALTVGQRGVLRVRVQRGLGGMLTVLAAPGRKAPRLLTERVTSMDQTFLVPVTVPAGEGWWRAEVRAHSAPTSVDTNAAKSGTVGTTSVLDQLQAFVSPVFTSTGAPASPRQVLRLPAQPAGLSDSAIRILGEAGVFTGFPDVAVSTDPRHGPGKGVDPSKDVVHLVAERHLPGGTTVVHTRVRKGAAQGPETVLTTSTSARFPRIAVAADWVHVVWQDERSGQLPRAADVWLRSSSNGGRSWHPEIKVSTSPGRSERPALAIDPDDPARPWVVWADNSDVADTGPTAPLGARQHAFDIWAARPGEAPVNLSASGKTTGPGSAYDTRSARWAASLHPSVTVRPDGGIVVLWQDNRFDPHPLWTGATPRPGSTSGGDNSLPDAWEPMGAVREPNGVWSQPLRVAPDAAASARHPQVIAEPSGRLVAVWSWKRLKAADANLALRSATSADGGRSWSSPEAIDPFPAAMMARPRLGLTTAGAARVAWSDTRDDDWRWRIRSATLGVAGWTSGANLTETGNGTYPAVDSDVVVCVSDRAALMQRDVTQQVCLVDLRPA